MKVHSAILLLFLVLSLSVSASENWTRFRGPTGLGQHTGKALPTQWGPEHVAWRVELNGEGHSSPINWEQRIFLTAASDKGRNRIVSALDARDGHLLWEKTIPCEAPEKVHAMNSHATATCATDGERVVAYFGHAGIHCFDLEGKPLWSQSLGAFSGPWGTSASPVFNGDSVIQNCDTQGESSLVALDRKTGTILWRTSRGQKPMGGWSTPIQIESSNHSELVINSEQGVDAYDPLTGKALWSCAGFNGRGEPAPVFAHDLLFLVNGKAGDVYAVRPGGTGEVSQTHRAWHTPRPKVRDISSPIVVGDFLFAIDMKGSAATYDAASGKLLWTERIPGAFSASPVASAGLIYLNNEAGETLVIRPGAKLEIVARNSIGDHPGELFRASIAPIDGRIYLRSNRALYCVSRG